MRVLIIRFEAFPTGSAPAFRTLNLAKLLSHCGNEVLVFAPKINIEKGDQCKLGIDFASIECFSPIDNERNHFQLLKSILQDKKPDVAILPSSIYSCRSLMLLHKKNIPVILDSVEWHNASNWRYKYADPRFAFFCICWKYVFPKVEGIIGISRLISNYYKMKLDNVERIPTITDCVLTAARLDIKKETPIRFIFSGQLDEGKDNLDTFIQAMSLVDSSRDVFQLDIYGPNKKEVERHLGKMSILLEKNENIIVHGRVPQQEAQEACKNSDFSVFFRLNRRSANAGFPTKLGECMTFGTPAICNDTGDISLVVKNRINGYLLKTKSVDEIADALRHILSLSVEEREAMRREARKSAEEFFDYRNYQEEIQKVLENAVKGRE